MVGSASNLSGALGLYVHWPFCARICPYCDFNVYRPKGQDGELLDAILADLDAWRAETGPRRLTSLHFGGGTPSLMSEDQVARVIERAEHLWGFVEGAEIGLEANPKDHDGFAGLRQAGINRLSLGVQSLRDETLTLLGRDHDAGEARRAAEMAQATFDRVSIDMIYAHHGQTIADWEAELSEALAFGTGHLSAYQLTIEARTAFGKRTERGEPIASDTDSAADLYEATEALFREAGYDGYEISNYARSPADQSVHNRLYWAGGDWIGVGPGAHGRLGRATAGGRLATDTVRRPGPYIDAVRTSGTGRVQAETLSVEDELAERILMGMRVAEGLDRRVLQAATGRDVDLEALARLKSDGLVVVDGDVVRLTPAARLLADSVSGALVP